MMITKDLIKSCVEGDEKSQRQLYELCFPFLMGVCIRFAQSKPDAMDFFNVGFFKILKSLKKYSGEGNFLGWAKRVMINSIIDEMRKQKMYNEHVKLLEESGLRWQVESQQDWFDELAVSQEEILSFISELPLLTSSVFNLFAIEGYKHKEIANMLGIGVSASKWHYASAKKKLQVKILKVMKSRSLSIFL
ncbi:MAG: DNA-directed RNA polymerase sigma-70 factor [Saprospiraceae bacterium]|nr:MAG: DNA-directed RNA polymerase sigma-70 factor [Saprospiraceae bacterium]